MRVARRCLLTVSAALLGAVPAASAQTAPDVPELLGARFTTPPVAGRESNFTVGATDDRHPVSGVMVAFTDGIFGESACRPRDSKGRKPRKPFVPSSPVRFGIDHVFAAAGRQPMAVRVDSGGCDTRRSDGGALVQPYTVTATNPGEPPARNPLVPGLPLPLPLGTTTTTTTGGGDGTNTAVQAPLQLPGLATLPGTTVATPQDTVTTVVDDPLGTVTGTVGGVTGTITDPIPTVTDPITTITDPITGLLPRVARAAQACDGADVVPTPETANVARASTLCLLNRERASRGLKPLRSDNRLLLAAVGFSGYMVSGRFFDHRGPDGSMPVARMRRAGYIKRKRLWRVGENVGFGEYVYASPRGMVQAWMQSTGHRVNILDPGYRDIGIGIVPGIPTGDSAVGATYTTDFGVSRRIRRARR